MGRQWILFSGSRRFQISDPIQKILHLAFEYVDLPLLFRQGQMQLFESLFLKGLRRLHEFKPGIHRSVFPAKGV